MTIVLLKEPPSGPNFTLNEQRMNNRRAHSEDCPFVARQREKGIRYYAFNADEAEKAGVLPCLFCGEDHDDRHRDCPGVRSPGCLVETEAGCSPLAAGCVVSNDLRDHIHRSRNRSSDVRRHRHRRDSLDHSKRDRHDHAGRQASPLLGSSERKARDRAEEFAVKTRSIIGEEESVYTTGFFFFVFCHPSSRKARSVQFLNDVKQKAAKFAEANAAALLTAGGVVGTVATAVLTGRASFKAAEILLMKERAACREHAEADRSIASEDRTTKLEKVMMVWPHFIPPVHRRWSHDCQHYHVQPGVGPEGCRFGSCLRPGRAQPLRVQGEGRREAHRSEEGSNRRRVGPGSSQSNVTGYQNIVIVEGEVLCFDEPTDDISAARWRTSRRRSTRPTPRSSTSRSRQRDLLLRGDSACPRTSWTDEVGWNNDRASGSEVLDGAIAGWQAVYRHRLQGPAQERLHPKALLDRLEAPELRLFPESYLGGGRRGRSSAPRAKLRTFEVTQDYPKRKRRWEKKVAKESEGEPFVITDQFGDPSLVLSRSYFFDDLS